LPRVLLDARARRAGRTLSATPSPAAEPEPALPGPMPTDDPGADAPTLFQSET
jgi:hypothetical protein